MRRTVFGFSAAILLAVGTAQGDSPSSADWNTLRSLVGSWQGTPDGAALLATHYCSIGNQPRGDGPGVKE